jgi:Tol biopolymer transport system component
MKPARTKTEFILALSLVIYMLLAGCASSPSDQGEDPGWPDEPMVLDIGPKWSPVDSTRIAYTHLPATWDELLEYGGPTVWVVDLESEEKHLLTRGILSDWSPDGTELLVGRDYSQFLLFELETGEEAHLVSLPWRCGDADFHPSGAKIAYVVSDLNNGGIWVLSLDSLISSRIHGGHGPDWSPDGTELLCNGLALIAEDGTDVGTIPYDSKLTTPQDCCWSPDGDLVAFAACPDSVTLCIYSVCTDGTELRLLAKKAQYPSWSPGTGMIAYSSLSIDRKTVVIWVMNSDGSAKRQVTFFDS